MDTQESGRLREFVGFTWQDDFAQQAGVLVWAIDATQASALVHTVFGEFGDIVRLSIWNEEDSAMPR